MRNNNKLGADNGHICAPIICVSRFWGAMMFERECGVSIETGVSLFPSGL